LLTIKTEVNFVVERFINYGFEINFTDANGNLVWNTKSEVVKYEAYHSQMDSLGKEWVGLSQLKENIQEISI
jgi:hypothetical protein